MPRRKRPRKNSLGPADKFVALRAGLRETQAWRSLGFAARAVLIEMMAGVHRDNNGRVARSVRFLADVVPASASTIQRALVDLEDRGFIVRTKGGHLGIDGHGQASRWRITEFGTTANPIPTKEYSKWQPKKTEPRAKKEHGVYRKLIRRHVVTCLIRAQGVTKIGTVTYIWPTLTVPKMITNLFYQG